MEALLDAARCVAPELALNVGTGEERAAVCGQLRMGGYTYVKEAMMVADMSATMLAR